MWDLLLSSVSASGAKTLPTLAYAFTVGGSAVAISSGAPTLSFDTIDYDRNGDLGLVPTDSIITIPAGVRFGTFSLAGKRGGTGEVYVGYAIVKNGTEVIKSAWHNGDYNVGHISGALPLSAGDEITFSISPDASTDVNVTATGTLYA